MSGHGWHEGCPGYSPHQILCDNCQECAERGQSPWIALGALDMERFAHAWKRAAEFGKGGLLDVSDAEVPLLRVLFSVAVQFERRGVPLGLLPEAACVAYAANLDVAR